MLAAPTSLDASTLYALNPAVASLRPSRTVVLTDKARQLREAGVDVISLAAGEPDFPTPAPVCAAGIEAIQSGVTRYTANSGTETLREAIARKLQAENAISVSPQQIVVSNGAKQSVWQAVVSTCGPGDEVLVPAPYWVSYPEMARLAGAKPVIVDSPACKPGPADESPSHSAEASRFLASAVDIKSALTPRSRLLILCSPSNPSGSVYTREMLESIAEVVLEHPRLLVLSDEIYEYIQYADDDGTSAARDAASSFPPSIASLPGMAERTLTVNGFSKAYAMTGWRLGYVAGPLPLARAMNIVQSQSTSGPSSIAQHAALAALAMGPRGGKVVQEAVRAFQCRRDLVVKKLRAMPGVALPEVPMGAFYALPNVSGLVGEGRSAKGYGPIRDAEALADYLLQSAHVAVVPGDAFGVPKSLRLSFALADDQLERALDRMAEALARVE